MDKGRTVNGVYGFFLPHEVASYGQSCVGCNGKPTQAMGGRFEIGGTIEHRLGRTPSNEAAVAVIGASKTQWGARALPFQFPGTNCLVSVSGDFFVYVTADNIGQATVPLAIPNRTACSDCATTPSSP